MKNAIAFIGYLRVLELFLNYLRKSLFNRMFLFHLYCDIIYVLGLEMRFLISFNKQVAVAITILFASSNLPYDNSTSCDTPNIKLYCRYLADFHILSWKLCIASFCYTYSRRVKTPEKSQIYLTSILFFHKNIVTHVTINL